MLSSLLMSFACFVRCGALLVVAAAACENRYVYVPVRNTGAQVAGRPAAEVGIPPEAPRGDVRLATFGIADIAPQGAPADARVRALHLRVVVANNAAKEWSIDTREQRVSLADRGESRAAYASADPGSPPPLVTVPPGGKRTIDLFFPLAANMARASELPAFDAVWSVGTDTRVVTERTPFERLQLEPRSSQTSEWEYSGPPYSYWYDPLYPGGAWAGATLPPAYVEQPVVIQRPMPVASPVR
jgi:hypothetical protein